MNKKFTKNKVVVITGGAKKIGRSTALKLAEQGFNIIKISANIIAFYFIFFD